MSGRIITVYTELHASPRPLCADSEKNPFPWQWKRTAQGWRVVDPAALGVLTFADISGSHTLEASAASSNQESFSQTKQSWGGLAASVVWRRKRGRQKRSDRRQTLSVGKHYSPSPALMSLDWYKQDFTLKAVCLMKTLKRYFTTKWIKLSDQIWLKHARKGLMKQISRLQLSKKTFQFTVKRGCLIFSSTTFWTSALSGGVFTARYDL